MHTTHLDCSKHAGEISYLRDPHLCLACGICLELAEISHDPARFIVQNVSDGKGIAVAEELEKGIRNRISDKSRKIRNQNKIGSYKNWWLILVDHVCHVQYQSFQSTNCSLSKTRISNSGLESSLSVPEAQAGTTTCLLRETDGSCPGAWCKSVALYAAPGG